LIGSAFGKFGILVLELGGCRDLGLNHYQLFLYPAIKHKTQALGWLDFGQRENGY